VDPLSTSYPWYTPYQFAGNKPIWFIDLDGAEEARSSTGFRFFPFLVSRKSPTPAHIMQRDMLDKYQKFEKSRAGKFTNGLGNTVTGLGGTIGSITYMSETLGAGAAFGGVIALQFSLGEMSIGIAQMVDAIANKKPNDILHNSNSIPGLIAYGTGNEYAPFFDALGQMTPTFAAYGSFKALVKSGLGVIDAAKTLNNTPSVMSAISLLDQISDTKGFLLESFSLMNRKSNGKMIQVLSYTFSYVVKKGETLSELATKFGTSVDEVQKQNNIKDANTISEGQKIKFRQTVYGGGSYGGGGAGGDTGNSN